MSYVNADSLVQLPDGQWVTAGVLAAFGGAPTNGAGQVQVSADTQVMMPGGGSMTAGAIDAFSYQAPTGGGGGTSLPPTGPVTYDANGGAVDANGQPVTTRGFETGVSGIINPDGTVTPNPNYSTDWNIAGQQTEYGITGQGGSTSQRRTLLPGTPGTYAHGDTLPGAPDDIPEWARQAFFGSGLTFGDFGRGVQGGTPGQYRVDTLYNAPPGYVGGPPTSTTTGTTTEAFQTVVPGTGGTAAQEDAYAQVRTILDQAGLGGLAGWAWEQIVAGDSADELYVKLRQTDAWKQRYGAFMEARQKAALPAMNEAQIAAYESTVRELFRSYGLPQGFFDQADDIAFLAGQNLSPAELQDRIVSGFAEVKKLPAAVQSAFHDFYGPGSDAALAALFLDPTKALPVLERQVAAATVGGTGRGFGFDFGASQSERLAAAGVDSLDKAQSGFARLDQLRPLLDERVSEHADLTAEGAGADAAFGTGSAAPIRERLNERVADFAGRGSGGSGFSVRGGGSTLGTAGIGQRR